MHCANCGAEITQADAYCRRCGRPRIPPVAAPPVVFQQHQRYPLAPYWSRLGAVLLDGVFAALLAIPGIVLLAAVMLSVEEPVHDEPAAGPLVLFMIVLLAPSMYYSYCKDGFKGGASWGKNICGLRVVHLETGQPCTKGRSFLRHILYLLNLYGIVTLVEIVMVYANPERRRLGDMIAGTMVIAADAPVFQTFPAPPAGSPPQYLDTLSRFPQQQPPPGPYDEPVSYTHLRAHET